MYLFIQLHEYHVLSLENLRWGVVAEITNVGDHPHVHQIDANEKEGGLDQGQEIGTEDIETVEGLEVVHLVITDLQIETGESLNEKEQIKTVHPQITPLVIMENLRLVVAELSWELDPL